MPPNKNNQDPYQSAPSDQVSTQNHPPGQPPQPAANEQVSSPMYAPTPEPPASKKRPKPLAIAIAVVIALGSLGAGLWLAIAGSNVDYDELTRTGTTAETTENISIEHPAEMEAVVLGDRRMELRHSGQDGEGLLSELLIEGVYYGDQFDDEREMIIDGLLDEGSAIHDEFIDELTFSSDNRFQVNISDFEKIDLENGITDALVADMSYQLPLISDDEEYIQAEGRIAVILGEEKLFLIRASALADIYRDNSAIFSDMIDSIQIES